MGRILIVANQTLGGAELEEAVRDRIEQGADDFYVLVPMTLPQDEAPTWRRGFEVGTSEGVTRLGGVVLTAEDAASDRAAREMEASARGREALLDEARARAQHRLEQMVERVRSAGGRSEGEVGDPNPITAVERALEDESFDEVIVSTLPAGVSRWLRMDVSSRVARMTDAPVTTLVAQPED